MFIDTIRISNFENPMGMALEPLTVSWKDREAVGKRAENVTLSVAMDPAMQNVILKKAALPCTWPVSSCSRSSASTWSPSSSLSW